MKKNIFFLFLLLSLMAQSQINIEAEQFSVLNLENSFITGGISTTKENSIVLNKYDKDFKLITTYSLDVKEVKVMQLLKMNSHTILVRTYKTLLSANYENYYFNDSLVLLKHESIDDNLKIAVTSSQGKFYALSGFKIYSQDDFYLYIEQGKARMTPTEQKSDVEADPVISLIQNKFEGDSISYKSKWQQTLPNVTLRYYQFIPWDNNRVFLYGSVKLGKNAFQEVIWGIDLSSGEILFKKVIELKDQNLQAAFSSAFYDKETKKLVIAGNYFKKNSPANQFPLEIGKCTMDGVFYAFLQENGNISASYEVPFKAEYPEKAKISSFDRRAIRIKSIVKTSSGDYRIIGENLMIDYESIPQSSIGVYYSGDCCLMYGFTVEEVNEASGVLFHKFVSVKSVDDNKFVKWKSSAEVWEQGYGVVSTLLVNEGKVRPEAILFQDEKTTTKEIAADGSSLIYQSKYYYWVKYTFKTDTFEIIPSKEKYAKRTIYTGLSSFMIITTDKSKISIDKVPF